MIRRFAHIFFMLVLALLVLAQPVSALETNLDEVRGSWKLIYKDGFGYEFRLKDNYRGYVVLHLRNKVIVFRGVYTIDNKDVLRINISDMKEQSSRKSIESEKGFMKTASSVFLFKIDKIAATELVLLPQKIQIDGRRSDGYFEPKLSLKKH